MRPPTMVIKEVISRIFLSSTVSGSRAQDSNIGQFTDSIEPLLALIEAEVCAVDRRAAKCFGPGNGLPRRNSFVRHTRAGPRIPRSAKTSRPVRYQ